MKKLLLATFLLSGCSGEANVVHESAQARGERLFVLQQDLGATEPGEFSVGDAPSYDLSTRERWLWSHLLRYRGFLLASSVLVIVSNLAYSQASMFTGWAAEEMLKPGGGRLLEYSIAILLILALDGVSNLASNYCAENIAKGLQADARQELYLSLLGKSQTFHGRQRVGDLMARATEDTSQLASMVVPGATLIVEGSLSIVIPCLYLGSIHVQLLLVPAAFVVCHVFALRAYMRQLDPVMQRQRKGFGHGLNSHRRRAIRIFIRVQPDHRLIDGSVSRVAYGVIARQRGLRSRGNIRSTHSHQLREPATAH